MTEPTNLILTDNSINTTNNSKPIKTRLDIKLKTDKKLDKMELETKNLLPEIGKTESEPGSSKRTQKAKSRKGKSSNTDSNDIGKIELPNTIDEIIGDMVFQEPIGFKDVATNQQQKDTLEQQQAQVLQKQKELLEQLQQGIRPGWFIQCIGRRADGKQCTRNIKKGSEFCMGHANKLAYGRIISPGVVSPDDITTNISSVVRGVMKPKSEWKAKHQDNFNSNSIEDSSSSISEIDNEDLATIPDDIKEIVEEPTGTTINDSTMLASSNTINTKKVKLAKHASKPKHSPETISDGQPTELAQTTSDVSKQPKKRGRRRKLPIDTRFGNNDYIIMWPIICEDQRFLTDRYENIYSNNTEHPVFIGIREVGGTINRMALPNSG
jgi:hypothetical protein